MTLTVWGPAGSSTATQIACVRAYDVPKANFAAAPGRGVAPLQVNFADKSKGSVTAWAWDFGDTRFSNEQNPVHTYADPGVYIAKLTVAGPAGTSTKVKRVSVRKPR